MVKNANLNEEVSKALTKFALHLETADDLIYDIVNGTGGEGILQDDIENFEYYIQKMQEALEVLKKNVKKSEEQ